MDPLIRPRVPLQPRFRGRPLLVSGLAATALALAVSCISPPLYRSTARFAFLGEDPNGAVSQLQHPDTLAQAGVSPARVKIQLVPDKGEVDVSVLDEDPDRAAHLANRLAGAYQDARAQLDAASLPERLSALESTLGTATTAYETAKREYEAVSQSLARAQDTFGEKPDGRWIRQGEMDAAIEYQALLTTQLEDLRQSPFPDFLKVANRHKLINSDRMVWVSEYFGTITTQEAQNQAGLPPTHPDVARTRKQAKALRMQLEKDAADLTATLALKVDALTQRLASLEEEKTAKRGVLVEALAAFKVSEAVYRVAQERLSSAKAAVEAERTAAATRPAYIAVVRPATPQGRAAQPGFWLPLLFSPLIGLAGGLLVQMFHSPSNGRRRAAVV